MHNVVFGVLLLVFVFFFFSHGVVSLFSIYEFECPSGIFHLCFATFLLHEHKLMINRANESDAYSSVQLDRLLTVFPCSQ